jgi:hypothetical protein
MKKALTTILIIAMVLGAAAWQESQAAGSATWTEKNMGRFMVYRCSWTSDASGNVSAGAGVAGITISGYLTGVNFKSVSGSVPSNLYDAEMLTADGQNVLYDAASEVNVGADIPSALTANGQRRTPYNKDGHFKQLYMEVVTPSITNAGNARSGIIELIVW